jgi:thiamine kinase-like enzyme
MNEMSFMDIVAANYNEIVRNFKAGVKNHGYVFDEDVMNDAFISCANSLKNKMLTKQEAIKYFWVAYVNKYKTKQDHEQIMDCYDNVEEEFEDVAVENYNSTTDKIYDIIISGVQDHFGVRKAVIWEMYACQGKSSKEIKAMGFNDIDNFAYFTKQVKRYIKNHIVAENRELQELIAERKEN